MAQNGPVPLPSMGKPLPTIGPTSIAPNGAADLPQQPRTTAENAAKSPKDSNNKRVTIGHTGLKPDVRPKTPLSPKPLGPAAGRTSPAPAAEMRPSTPTKLEDELAQQRRSNVLPRPPVQHAPVNTSNLIGAGYTPVTSGYTRGNLVSDLDQILLETNGRSRSEEVRVLAVGDDLAELTAQLPMFAQSPDGYLDFKVTCLSSMQKARAFFQAMREERAVMSFVLGSSKLPDADAASLISEVQIHDHDVPIIIFSREPPSHSDRQAAAQAGAVDTLCLKETTTGALASIMRTHLDSTRMRRGLRTLLATRRQALLSDDEAELRSRLYSQDRIRDLEKHLLILEEWKHEAERALLLFEQENLSVKAEVLQLRETVSQMPGAMVSHKWKNDPSQRHNGKDKSKGANGNARAMIADPGGFLTPLQQATATVARLSKVTEFLAPADLKQILESLVSHLQADSLYTPDREMFERLPLDDMTKEFLVATFTPLTDAEQQRMLSKMRTVPALLRGPKYDNSDPEVHAARLRNTALVEMLSQWDFDVFAAKMSDVSDYCLAIFDYLGLMSEFHIPLDRFRGFIQALQAAYNENPFHNMRHAFDVMQMCFLIARHTKLKDYIRKIDLLALMVSALCHDIGHPAVTNLFLMNSEDPLANTYNDTSVLENFHCSSAFDLIHTESNNIFVNLTPVERKEVRRCMVSAILSTDMTGHFELKSRFNTLVENLRERNEQVFSVPKNRQLLINVVLHAADLSNMTRPEKVARKWSDCVFEEFLAQGDREASLGLPISPYMNRHDTNQIKMSVNFIDFVVMPLYECLHKLFPELNRPILCLTRNRKLYEQEQETTDAIRRLIEHRKTIESELAANGIDVNAAKARSRTGSVDIGSSFADTATPQAEERSRNGSVDAGTNGHDATTLQQTPSSDEAVASSAQNA